MIFSTFDAFANINERLYATPDNYCKNGISENLTYSTHSLFLENNIHDIASELFLWESCCKGERTRKRRNREHPGQCSDAAASQTRPVKNYL